MCGGGVGRTTVRRDKTWRLAGAVIVPPAVPGPELATEVVNADGTVPPGRHHRQAGELPARAGHRAGDTLHIRASTSEQPHPIFNI